MTIARGKIKGVKEGTKDAKFISKADLVDARAAEARLSGSKLKPGDVGTYKELDKIGVKGDLRPPDHIPSRASIVASKQAERMAQGKWPSNARQRAKLLRQLNEDAVAIGTEADIHAAGRTFGGKNTAAQIALDARDLGTAARKDFAAVMEALHNEGKLTTDRVVAYLKAYNLNVAKNAFKYSKETSKMFLRFLELAAK
jgi:filamentous hemagglutinin